MNLFERRRSNLGSRAGSRNDKNLARMAQTTIKSQSQEYACRIGWL